MPARDLLAAMLQVATDSQIEELYRETHTLWGGGLTAEDYLALWRDLAATPWGSKYLTFLVWSDDRGTVLSSMKLYRPLVRYHGATCRAAVLGAVYTPLVHRRRGHAGAMLRAALDEARDRGDQPALLFSDVGVRYYEALDFVPLPAEECWGEIPPVEGKAEGGYEFLQTGDEHLEDIVPARNATIEGAELAMVRDREHWSFLLERSRNFFSRLRAKDMFHRFRAAFRDGRFAGYLVTVEGLGCWNIREVGAVGGDPVVMAGILRAASAQAVREGFPKVYGWLPAEVTARLGDWGIRRCRRDRAIPMISPLQGDPDLNRLNDPDAVQLMFMDQF